MLLHSPSLKLQKRALPHVERAARRREIPPDDFAMLTDHVLTGEHKPQLYGTRFDIVGGKLVLRNVKDPAHLEERRRKLGLMPMSEYVKGLEELYKMPVDTSGIPR